MIKCVNLNFLSHLEKHIDDSANNIGSETVTSCQLSKKQSMGRFYVCKCFYTKNIFLKNFNIHIEYQNKQQFLEKYSKV